LKKILIFLLLAHLSFSQKTPNIIVFIADDWSKHAGVYGDKVIKTPNIDKIASEGIVFQNAFCAAPSCTPSRAAILTGRYPHQLGEGGNLYGTLSAKYPNYAKILEKQGYHVGLERKGWGPGKFENGGYEHNPAGKLYRNFEEFFSKKPENQPFCFWFGSQDPHRAYIEGSGVEAGINSSLINVPAWLPNHPIIKSDLADYYFEVQRFDREIGEVIEKLKISNEYDNTLIIVTSDNGMPFPRAKANIYDTGTNIPLIISWKNGIKPNPQLQNTFVNLLDLAPTFLEITNIEIPKEMTGKSLLPFLKNQTIEHRQEVYLERERHANVRKGNESYPIRAIRNDKFLYIRNFEPDLHPAGDPVKWYSVGRYGDVDASPSKDLILDNQNNFEHYYQRAFGKRPAEELYDLSNDPDQLKNVINDKKYTKSLKNLRSKLNKWMKTTQDPRTKPTKVYSEYPYNG